MRCGSACVVRVRFWPEQSCEVTDSVSAQQRSVRSISCLYAFPRLCNYSETKQIPANNENTLRGKNGVRAFCHNSAESEPIWMKFGAL